MKNEDVEFNGVYNEFTKKLGFIPRECQVTMLFQKLVMLSKYSPRKFCLFRSKGYKMKDYTHNI